MSSKLKLIGGMNEQKEQDKTRQEDFNNIQRGAIKINKIKSKINKKERYLQYPGFAYGHPLYY